MPRSITCLLTTLFLVLAVAAHTRAEPPVAPKSDRTLQHSAVIAAPIDELWTAFTTPDGIRKSWSVAQADIDFRVGGTIRTHYKPEGVLGDGGTIIHAILAYEPGRMLALKTTKTPDTAPEPVRLICREGWFVIRLEPLSAHRTRYTETMMGFGEGEDFDKAYEFFDKGNAWTIKKMQQAFRPADEDQRLEGTEKALHSLAGTWEFRKELEGGKVFRGRTEITTAMTGHLLFGLGSLGDDKSLTPHSHLLAYRDPESGAMRILNVNEKGDITQGEARLESPDKLILDWDTIQLADGKSVAYRVEYTLKGPDAFGLAVLRPVTGGEPGQREKLVEVEYKRVQADPVRSGE